MLRGFSHQAAQAEGCEWCHAAADGRTWLPVCLSPWFDGYLETNPNRAQPPGIEMGPKVRLEGGTVAAVHGSLSPIRDVMQRQEAFDGKPQDVDRKAGIRNTSRQRYDSPRQEDLSIPWCPQVKRSNRPGLVNLKFRTEAVTCVLNFYSAACRGCEFHQGMGKPQATGVLHQSPQHPCCHCCPCCPQ